MAHKKETADIMTLFEKSKYLTVCAPMVRYSKVQFRNLVRQYNCDLCFSPMIMADSFCQSKQARLNEFSTNICDSPTIVQFAAHKVEDFVEASRIVSPYCNGVDLNCGCPQRWAKQMGIGCVMLENPQQIYNIVRECRNRISKPFTVSVKMRLLKDIRKLIEICKQLENCGVSFLTIHGRTSSQQKGDANIEAIKLVVENVKCPVIANGGITNIQECEEMYTKTGCKGIMVANGLLTNPTLFTGTSKTTIECIQNWLNICYNSTLTPELYARQVERGSSVLVIPEKPLNLTFQCFHHHLVFMLEKVLPRYKRRVFNSLQTFESVLNFVDEHLGLTCKLFEPEAFASNCILDLDYCDITNTIKHLQESEHFSYYDNQHNGKYFKNKVSGFDFIEECYFDMFSEVG